MGYIVTAEVYTDLETNMHGDKSKVDARILCERTGYIEFDVRGEFGMQQEITRRLCNTLIDAGFVEFRIGHSY